MGRYPKVSILRLFLVVAILSALENPVLVSGNRLNVCVRDGCLLGKAERGHKRPYDAFYGVPYAAPPIGPLRFENPTHTGFYEGGVWNSTYPRSECIQNDLFTKDITGSEDCLYLNLYKPRVAQKVLPVLVFLHPGAFKSGGTSPNMYGPEYLMDKGQMIVVTVAFRLGVFGFISSGDDQCKGNFGLKDQWMALRWLRNNVAAFGGDPKAITLMGVGSGAVATQLHMLSRKSNDLFQRAIMMGGQATASWAINKNPSFQLRQFAALAQVSDFTTATLGEMVDQLRTMDANYLQYISTRIIGQHEALQTFGPVVEGDWPDAFVVAEPKRAWKSGKYQHRPFWVIVSGYEQGDFADIYYNHAKRKGLLRNLESNLRAATGSGSISEVIKEHYLESNPTEENLFKLTMFMSDEAYMYPMYQTVYDYVQYGDVQKNPVDLMLFNFTSTYSTSEFYHPYSHPEKGPSKADALMYLFTWSVLGNHFRRGAAEEQAKDEMVELFSQYVKEGLEHNDVYPLCSAQQMETGICPYLLAERQEPDGFQLGVSNAYDIGAVSILRNIYGDNKWASKESETPTTPIFVKLLGFANWIG